MTVLYVEGQQVNRDCNAGESGSSPTFGP
jgi:hypothetical protein